MTKGIRLVKTNVFMRTSQLTNILADHACLLTRACRGIVSTFETIWNVSPIAYDDFATERWVFDIHAFLSLHSSAQPA